MGIEKIKKVLRTLLKGNDPNKGVTIGSLAEKGKYYITTTSPLPYGGVSMIGRMLEFECIRDGWIILNDGYAVADVNDSYASSPIWDYYRDRDGNRVKLENND